MPTTTGAVGLDGFENWYLVQAQEERDHAMLFYRYLQNNDQRVTFEAISKPECSLTDHMAPLKAAYQHEQYVTSLINNIYAAAAESKDYRTMQLLDWFVKEQGEEEKSASDLITKMELYGTDGKAFICLTASWLVGPTQRHRWYWTEMILGKRKRDSIAVTLSFVERAGHFVSCFQVVKDRLHGEIS